VFCEFVRIQVSAYKDFCNPNKIVTYLLLQNTLFAPIPKSQLASQSFSNPTTLHDLHYSVHGFVSVTCPTIVTSNKSSPSQYCRQDFSTLAIVKIQGTIRILCAWSVPPRQQSKNTSHYLIAGAVSRTQRRKRTAQPRIILIGGREDSISLNCRRLFNTLSR